MNKGRREPDMKLNHVAHRLDAGHFETMVELLTSRLGFFELRRTAQSIWLRQAGANVDLQFSLSKTAHRDADKRASQVSFLSDTPRADLESLAEWVRAQGLDATVGSWSDKEFFLDVPAAFVDFEVEAMTPEMADYRQADGSPFPTDSG